MSTPVIPYILIVEDQVTLLRAFSKMLRQQGFEVVVSHSATQVDEILATKTVSTAIISMELADCDGLSLIRRIALNNPVISILAIAASGSVRNTVAALEAGAIDYFLRPITNWTRFYHILRTTQRIWSEQLELQKLRDQMERLRSFRSDDRFDDIKGSSSAIQQLLSEIHAVAPLNISTLILGESGVGKELVARAIHKYSTRKEGPFVPINCAAISPDLFEAELFGHRKGAYTGASQSRSGLCSAANAGTLFLDEIADLPLALQPKLLRLLEQREYRAVGSDSIQQFTGRVVAATNVDLETAVASGTFREDLYFRLSSQELTVPPLRERKGDIQLLAYHFIEKYNTVCNRSVHQIDKDALAMLENYDWHRNNVRELEREIQRGLVRSSQTEAVLRPEALFWRRGQQVIPARAETDGDLMELPYAEALAQLRLRFLPKYLTHQLNRSQGNKSKAAELSGMNPSNFFRLLREIDH